MRKLHHPHDFCEILPDQAWERLFLLWRSTVLHHIDSVVILRRKHANPCAIGMPKGGIVMQPEPGQPKSLAMIHTVSALIQVLEPIAKQELAGWSLFNMLDESLLRNTIREGSLSVATIRRLTGMVWSAVDAGADAIVVTCSSLGPAVEAARALCPVPLFRIDEGMALAAVGMGRRIGVLATLRTTLDPTSDLIRRTAARQGNDCVIISSLADGAFERLQQGDTRGHDQMVGQSIRELASKVDVIVLAQASMARAAAGVKDAIGALPVLTSPELGIRHLGRMLRSNT